MVGTPPGGEVKAVAPVHEVQLGSPHVAVGPRRPLASREGETHLYLRIAIMDVIFSLETAYKRGIRPKYKLHLMPFKWVASSRAYITSRL